MQAEWENFRKRARRELDDERRYAELSLLTDLLPVIDNVGRAITAGETRPIRRVSWTASRWWLNSSSKCLPGTTARRSTP